MIDVYVANIDLIENRDVYFRLYNQLNSIRRNKIDRNKNISDKYRSLLAGCLLKYAIEDHNFNYYECEFEIEENGYEKIKSNNEIFFSLSHSNKYCVCAFSDSIVGVDIECVQRFTMKTAESLAMKIMTDRELDIYHTLDGCDQSSYFAKVWTRKEAYSKVCKKGLTMNFKKIETDKGLFFYTFTMPEGYSLSLASENIIRENDIILKNVTKFLEVDNA